MVGFWTSDDDDDEDDGRPTLRQPLVPSDSFQYFDVFVDSDFAKPLFGNEINYRVVRNEEGYKHRSQNQDWIDHSVVSEPNV